MLERIRNVQEGKNEEQLLTTTEIGNDCQAALVEKVVESSEKKMGETDAISFVVSNHISSTLKF